MSRFAKQVIANRAFECRTGLIVFPRGKFGVPCPERPGSATRLEHVDGYVKHRIVEMFGSSHST